LPRTIKKACLILAAGSLNFYAAFFCPALIFAQRARIASPIFFRAAADIVCFGFPRAHPVASALPAAGFASFRTFAHRAFCACAILLLEAAEITRAGWFAFWDDPVPFSDSITEIA
jgi:hypothetical protein